MKTGYFCTALMVVILLIPACTIVPAVDLESQKKTIDKIIDDFHDAAAQGDKQRYLAHFSKQAIFMGTDDWERWPLNEFSQYVDKHFKDGAGWSYNPIERNIRFSASARTAWFDEIIFSEKWGRFRGTGVLIRENRRWKLAHYAMAFLVPNEVWEDTSALTKKAFKLRSFNEKSAQ